MSIEGCLVAAVIATLCMLGRNIAIISSVCSFAFPSTAMVTLTSLGGASVTLPQFGLVCLFTLAIFSGDIGYKVSNIFKTESSAQILSLVVLFAVSGAFIMPRLFQDVTEVFSLARGAGGKGNVLSTVPLTATSGNITQPFYFLGNVAGFFSVLMLCQTEKGIESFFKGMIALVSVHTIGGGVDFISKYAVGFDLLEFLRTAKYAMLVDVDILDFKRIVGLYPEASSFAYASVAYTSFMFGVWRIIHIRYGGLLFFACLACLLVSTSSTAYFCVVILLAFYGFSVIRQIGSGKIEEMVVIVVLLGLLATAILIAILLLYPKTLTPFTELISRMVLNKADSESARQRFGWNTQAIKNFVETFGIGAGLGSLRSSSWPLTLIAEQGMIGLGLFGAFVASLFLTSNAPKSRSSRRLVGIAQSSQMMVVGTLVAAVTSSALFDLGAPFYIAAGCIVAAKRIDRRDTLYQKWFSRDGTIRGRTLVRGDTIENT